MRARLTGADALPRPARPAAGVRPAHPADAGRRGAGARHPRAGGGCGDRTARATPRSAGHRRCTSGAASPCGMASRRWSRAPRSGAARDRGRGPAHRGRAADARAGRRGAAWHASRSSFLADGLTGLRLRRPRGGRARPDALRAPPTRSPAMPAWASPVMPANGVVPAQVRRALELGAVAHRPRLPDRGRPVADGGAHRARRDARPVPDEQRPGGDRARPSPTIRWPGCIGQACR